MTEPRRAIVASWERGGWIPRVLAPLGWAYSAVMRVRNVAYDLGIARSHALPSPAISVGNLTVGGTGKTPVSAWVAQQLQARGARPAILLRGYGDDEPLVHQRLTPGAIVIADPDRVAGARRAVAAGATVLVLDDAFQHRRARRDADLVLLAAEQGIPARVLPAGPLREPVSGLCRAAVLVVTRKGTGRSEAERLAEAWRRAAPGVPAVVLHLQPAGLVPVGGAAAAAEALPALAGTRVLAVSAIGAPGAFEAQLRAAGAIVEGMAFPDHHPFSAVDVAAITARAAGAARVVCTLKDAVKLEALWTPQAPPLWYLSQTVDVEQGGEVLDDLFDRLVGRRSP
ncbi:MAG: hypothetical protein RL139_1169 [Gemmatimonadota bacterium]